MAAPDPHSHLRRCYNDPDADICHGAAVLREYVSQVLKAAYLLEPYPIYLPLSMAMTLFLSVLVSIPQEFELSVSLLVVLQLFISTCCRRLQTYVRVRVRAFHRQKSVVVVGFVLGQSLSYHRCLLHLRIIIILRKI